MAKLIYLQTIQSSSGKLTVFENLLMGGIRRVFYIYDSVNVIRGRHRHRDSIHALCCVAGKCKVYVNNGEKEEIYYLDSPEKCLILEPHDWREMYDFDKKSILLCMSNQFYDPEDYIEEPYTSTQKFRDYSFVLD
ncbi:MAG: FdtA/QdtA family cupin domain-containing protein [Spirosomaceae bacterium]|jgi:dTDP-4-dehydrorhamnose 3,5-epimerase-like enzyme|nr:FdtA/QdtA family cupin domain-containing protein [Spirosomataceae bacterium]